MPAELSPDWLACKMGKAFGGNSKAEAGRERKAAHKELKKIQQKKKAEEAESREWEKGIKTKSERQILEEKKRTERLQRKQEREKLEALEAVELEKYKPPSRTLSEVKKTMGLSAVSKPTATSTEPPFIASLRDQDIHGDDAPVYSASNIDDALFLLEATSSTSSLNKVERHPERRAKPAFAAYEAKELPRLRAEFPQLRLSQLKQKLYEGWQKSSDNPFNQSHVSYNATKSQEMLRTQDEIESRLRQMQLPPS